jgi:hypothetical protein
MLERRARDKHSSLLQKFVNYGQKKFHNIGPRCTFPFLEWRDGVTFFDDMKTAWLGLLPGSILCSVQNLLKLSKGFV